GGCGTVYRVSTTGTEKVLYSFHGGSSDGANPAGNLIDVNGTLYGTTANGGGGCGIGCGTVYSISTTGTETMLHSFDHKYDGQQPYAGLLDVNGTLYGTTKWGGSSGNGTVYSISTSGSEKVLFSFGRNHDGAFPVSGLINVKGTLYGTTYTGGSSGYGTVYSITTTGTEKVLHSFSSAPDGAMPTAGLIDVSGTLYGTTPAGGDAICYEVGQIACGVVYSITTSGREKVLHTFTPASDGPRYPYAGLVNVRGIMYGTTEAGGQCDSCGVVYSVTTAGYLTTLHYFLGGSGGASPNSNMIDVNGTLYGTTPSGGSLKCDHHQGCGTAFALTP
ncbi:MAG TPA: choice-of-anchor tandem repeat GloVer-containing protein, partial [Candidatus Binatia bacterium]|nr:choice-of-anchor tandem repeat GloVer-containing protein [Candidatus Binatia bacterium]